MAANAADLSGGPVLLSLSLATASFALSTTFVRFCVRAGINSGFGYDDYASGVATVVALIGTIFGIIESTASDPARALEFDVLGQPWYLMSVTLSKISICLFLMGLLGRARQWRILLGVLIVLMAAVNLAFSLTVNLQCRPLEKVWKPQVEGSCWDPRVQLNFGYFQGAFSVFSWFFLALFPIVMARDLTRGGQKSWPFYVTSMLSFASGIFAIIRTAQTSQTSGTSVYTLHYFYASLMANLEQNLGLISANVLVLGPLFSSTNNNSSSNSSSSRSRSRRRNKTTNNGTKPRRDPYSSASSAGSSRSRRSNRATKPRPPPSRAGSSQSITDPIIASATRASSRASSNHRARVEEEEDKDEESRIGMDKGGGGERSASGLIIQGAGVVRGVGSGASHDDGDDYDDDEEYDLGDPRRRRGRLSESEDDDDYDDEEEEGGEYGSDGDEIDLRAWPRGIIKTVSVEVVEEINTEYLAAAAAPPPPPPPHPHHQDNNNMNNISNASSKNGGQSAAVTARGSRRQAGGIMGRRNSIIIAPGGRRQQQQQQQRRPPGAPSPVAEESIAASDDRVSGASGVEQDWEAMLRAGPPR